MMISDLVVIWRLWTVIPEQRKRATIVPVLFYIFSSGENKVFVDDEI